MFIRDLMTRDVKTCRPTDTLHEAARIMWENDCGCLPVVDHEGRPCGMITDRDLCMAAYMQDRALRDLTVDGPMSKDLGTCGEGDPVDAAERVMREKQVRRLPVVGADGRLIGLISLNDIVREVAREVREGEAEIAEDELVGTMATICEPAAR